MTDSHIKIQPTNNPVYQKHTYLSIFQSIPLSFKKKKKKLWKFNNQKIEEKSLKKKRMTRGKKKKKKASSNLTSTLIEWKGDKSAQIRKSGV